MAEYISGSFRCKICAREYLTKEEADAHYRQEHYMQPGDNDKMAERNNI